MKPLVIYHANCADGFAAAWCFYKTWPCDCDFHPGVYGEDPPDVAGRNVFMVDFSYKRAVVDRMCQVAERVTVLDHHKTAIEDLRGLEDERPNFHKVFDTRRSGAKIAWDYINLGAEPPPLLRYVQDRDLWSFALPDSREVSAALFSYEYDFELWTNLMLGTSIERMVSDGRAILRKHDKDVAELVRSLAKEAFVGGHKVPVLNAPYLFSSDAGHIMSKGRAFAACYYDGPDHRNFSLRSAPDGLDVSEIAKQYGGGGHKHAAGFRVPLSHPLCALVDGRVDDEGSE